jgi:asparagine synthase (glutamine-hydrolysing)
MDHHLNIGLQKLKKILRGVINEDPAEGLLLSGGLDTSIIALLASDHVKKAFTVSLEGCEKDLVYAEKVAEFLDLDHEVYLFDEDEMLRALPEVIDILGTHTDFQVRGAVPILIALKGAKNCVKSIYAGDGADELFAGYGSMVSLISSINSVDDDLFGDDFKKDFQEKYLSRLLLDLGDYLRSPYKLGKSVGIDVKLPYLNEKVVEYAIETPIEWKVREERGKPWGKWILRKAFEDDLPGEIIWREKTPIDIGTGSIRLRDILGMKEELFYYEILHHR